MTKIFIILLLQVFWISGIQSQDIGIGTQWIYNQYWWTPLPTNEDKKTLEIVSDTIIDNKQYFKLSGNCECSFDVELILRWENNQVYRYFNETENILYDFDLVTGDSLFVNFPLYQDSIATTVVIIDSVDVVNGYKIQHVSISQSLEIYTDWSGVFIQEFGAANWCITPQDGLCENGTYGLCKVISPENDTIQFTEIYNCLETAVDDYTINPLVSVYPNPTDFEWILPADLQIVEYFICNLEGKLMQHEMIRQNKDLRINASRFETGLYVLWIRDRKDNIHNTKLMKY